MISVAEFEVTFSKGVKSKGFFFHDFLYIKKLCNEIKLSYHTRSIRAC